MVAIHAAISSHRTDPGHSNTDRIPEKQKNPDRIDNPVVRQYPMAKRTRSTESFLTATVKLHVVHDPEQNTRLLNACTEQGGVHNHCIHHLLKHRSDEPLQKSAAKGVTGLQGRWPTWRAETARLSEIPSLIARGAIAAATDQIAKWEATNEKHARLVIEDHERHNAVQATIAEIRASSRSPEEQTALISKALETDKGIPRRVQRRIPDPKRLYRSRKREERTGNHRCRMDEGVRRIDQFTLQIAAIGRIRTKEKIPEDLDVRSCVILERTPEARLERKPSPGDRTFRINVSGRKAKPALKSPDEPGLTVGIDHGIVNAMTTVDTAEATSTFQHDLEEAHETQHRLRGLNRKTARCKRFGNRWP